MNEIKRAAIYLRTSSQDQKTDLQADELLPFVERRGWILYRVFEDKISGTTNSRPQLNQLMTDARERKYDVLVIWKLDRLFRSLKNLVVTLDEFKDIGVELVSLKDNLDLTTSAGRLLMQIIGAMAEFEHSLIRARTKAGLEAAKKRGTKLGRPQQVNHQKVLELRSQGLSLKAISRVLGCSKTAVHKVLQEYRSENRQEILKSGDGK